MRKTITSIVLLVYSSIAYGVSWVLPNDPWLRADLEYASTLHTINYPLSSWPLSMSTIHQSRPKLSQNSLITIHAINKSDFKLKISAAQDQPIFSDFGFVQRDKSSSNLSYYHQNGPLEVHFTGQVSAVTDLSPDVTHDNTYVNVSLGDWTLGAGAVDRWWGPGWDSGLILTTNARPIPSLYVTRNISSAPTTPWLNWIGPWNLVTFMGQLEEDRAIPNALLWGMRAVFRPSKSWEIGLSRTAMWAGDDRPKDLEVFTDILVGNDNIEPNNASKADEPGNQLAGFDFKYSNHFHSSGYSIYGELIGEDEVGGRPSRPLIMFGASIHFSVQHRTHTVFAEYSDTALNGHKSEQLFGIAYRHGLYTTGYLYKGRPLGSTYDNDSQTLAIGTLFELANNYKIRSTFRYLNLNRGTAVESNEPTNNSISSQKLKTQQISLVLAKSWSAVSTDLFFLWNSNAPEVTSDNISSLAGASVSLRL